MKNMKISKGTLILIIVLSIVALAGVGFGTFAFFTASATSETKEITSGTLSMAGNGENLGFKFDIGSKNFQPGDYVTKGPKDKASIKIENTGNLEMIYMANFRYADGNKDNLITNALVFEELVREKRNANGGVISRAEYITNYEFLPLLNINEGIIDNYDINGKPGKKRNKPVDGLISVREWIDFCRTKKAGLEGIYAGKLNEGEYETWTLKIKFHETAGNVYNIKGGLNVFMDYTAEATQNTTDAIVTFLANQKVINLEFDNAKGDFDKIAKKWNSEL